MMKSFIGFMCVYLSLLATSVLAAGPNTEFQSTRGDLELKSTATAKWMAFITVYDAGLYAPKLAKPKALLQNQTPLSLEIRYRVDVKKDQLIEAAEVALSRQHDAIQRSLFQNDVDALHSFYRDVSAGDQFRIDVNPRQGLVLYFNNSSVYQNDNVDFARYYVGLWLADNPLSDRVRDALLTWKN